MRRLRKYLLVAGPLLLLLVTLTCARAADAPANDCDKSHWDKSRWDKSKVVGVHLPYDSKRAVTSYVELGDVLAVESADLAALRKCATTNNPVLLYLNGMPLKGMLEFPPSNPAGNEAFYELKITSDDRSVWNKLLGSPTPGTPKPEVPVSLGLADGFAVPSDVKIALRPLPPIGFAVWAVLFIGGLIAFFVLACKSGLIRGGTPAGGQVFSISRSQAAWWFFLVLAAYLLIGLTTGDYTTSLNQTALTLLGIAAGTYLGSAAVDASKNTPAERDAQNQEKTRLDNIAEPNKTPADKDKLVKLKGESQGWLMDVLSDSEGVDFHRFQMLAWTFVLGIIFITQVWTNLAMPEFGATLLGLMGLSAGTYVGLKIPETTK
jgi:hypothetical protein